MVEIALELFVAMPGAFILWSTRGFRGTISGILVNEENKSMGIGVVFWILIAAVGGLIARSFS